MVGTEQTGLRGANRRRPWRPYGQDFKPIDMPAPQITLCSPEEGEWRYAMGQTICLEAGYDYEYPFDQSEKFLWQEGQGIVFALNDKLHSATVTQRFVGAYRKRYWLKFANNWRLTITEKQLSKLMQVTAARFKRKVSIVPAECRAIVVWKPEGTDTMKTPTSLAASPVSPPPSIPPAREKQIVLDESITEVRVI